MKVESNPWRFSENTVELDHDDEKFTWLEVFGNFEVSRLRIQMDLHGP